MENDKAQEKYDDAIAEGNLAAVLKESQNLDLYQIDIGNILPGKTISIEIEII